MTEANTAWRVAVVGSGPAAFYTAEALFKSGVEGVSVDLFDRLPVPFGLVRGGVAPIAGGEQPARLAQLRLELLANFPYRLLLGCLLRCSGALCTPPTKPSSRPFSNYPVYLAK